MTCSREESDKLILRRMLRKSRERPRKLRRLICWTSTTLHFRYCYRMSFFLTVTSLKKSAGKSILTIDLPEVKDALSSEEMHFFGPKKLSTGNL